MTNVHDKGNQLSRFSYDLIIVGLGAAGLMAAALSKGLNVLGIEKNSQAGKKVLISGKGQCNFTHDANVKTMAAHYGNRENFVKHALGKLSPEKTRAYFESLGVPSMVMDNGKVFPKSLDAGDLVGALINEAYANQVNLLFKTKVTQLAVGEAGGYVVTTQSSQGQGRFTAAHVLIATGGYTYPVTGSEGDGYELARKLGIAVATPRPALTPIYHHENVLKGLAGVSIPEAQITLKRSGQKPNVYTGDLLFTHKGLSGPVILNNSRDFCAGDVLSINFTRETAQQLEARLIQALATEGKQTVVGFVRKITVARAMADALMPLLALPEGLTIAQMNKVQRTQIVKVLTQFEVCIDRLGGAEIAMVAAGGISLEALIAKRMMVKDYEGLYVAGEVCDIDGDTGGYNIQWAFSSAALAVNDIISKLK